MKQDGNTKQDCRLLTNGRVYRHQKGEMQTRTSLEQRTFGCEQVDNFDKIHHNIDMNLSLTPDS